MEPIMNSSGWNQRIKPLYSRYLLLFLLLAGAKHSDAAWDHGIFPDGITAQAMCESEAGVDGCIWMAGSNPVCPGDYVKYFFIYRSDPNDWTTGHHFAYCPPYEGGKENGSEPISKPCEGNPCNPSTGNKIQAEVDVRKFPYSPDFIRHYNSMSSANKAFGYGWTASYFQSLNITGTTVKVYRPSGRGETFTCNSYDAACVGDPDSFFRLYKYNGGYALTLPDDSIEVYDFFGKLLKIKVR